MPVGLFLYLLGMLQVRNESLQRECPKGTKRVVISERISAGLPFTGSSLSGTCTLRKRIDDAVGFRVLYVAITQTPPMSVANGSLIVLSSGSLGARVATNPFVLATSLDVANLEAVEFSSVIGVSPIYDANSRELLFGQVNSKFTFTGPSPVESFDWTVSVLNGTFNLTSAFAVEIVLEFYKLCQCRVTL